MTTLSVPEPVPALPDRLVERLVHTAGMAEADVARLSLGNAVDAWTAWASGQRPTA